MPAVTVTRTDAVPGGAGNLAANLAALGATVELLAVVGDDEPGRHLRAALEEAGVGTGSLLIENGRRHTIVKRRLVAEGQLVARFDEGDRQAPGEADAARARRTAQGPRCHRRRRQRLRLRHGRRPRHAWALARRAQSPRRRRARPRRVRAPAPDRRHPQLLRGRRRTCPPTCVTARAGRARTPSGSLQRAAARGDRRDDRRRHARPRRQRRLRARPPALPHLDHARPRRAGPAAPATPTRPGSRWRSPPAPPPPRPPSSPRRPPPS